MISLHALMRRMHEYKLWKHCKEQAAVLHQVLPRAQPSALLP